MMCRRQQRYGMHALLGALAVGCGPEAEESMFTPGIFVQEGFRHGGMLITPPPPAVEFREDGSAVLLTATCGGFNSVGDGFSWEKRGSTIVVRESEGSEYSRLELAPSRCGPHEYIISPRDDGSPYSPGKYCPTDISEGPHVPATCAWAPCDSLAEECTAVFERDQ